MMTRLGIIGLNMTLKAVSTLLSPLSRYTNCYINLLEHQLVHLSQTQITRSYNY